MGDWGQALSFYSTALLPVHAPFPGCSCLKKVSVAVTSSPR